MNQDFFQAAARGLSLFTSPENNRELIEGIAAITGIPIAVLRATEQRIRASHSFQPLRDLLEDPRTRRMSRLTYRISLKQKQLPSTAGGKRLAHRLILELKTKRGAVMVTLHMLESLIVHAGQVGVRDLRLGMSIVLQNDGVKRIFRRQVRLRAPLQAQRSQSGRAVPRRVRRASRHSRRIAAVA